MTDQRRVLMTGVITSRQCPVCGHHELGFTTNDGSFYPLRPGACVQLLDVAPGTEVEHPSMITTMPKMPQVPHMSTLTADDLPEDVSTRETKPRTKLKPWLPDPCMGNKNLRLRYGVMIDKDIIETDRVDAATYAAAYLQKLEQLIEKDVHTNIIVILDMHFAAPQLASGDSGQIALNMWQELEEIRQPVKKMGAWLENSTEENLLDLTHSERPAENSDKMVNNETLKKELEELTLDNFLGTIS